MSDRMTPATVNVREDVTIVGDVGGHGTYADWCAILAGGLAAIVVTVVLMTLGTGLGLMAVSPWENKGVTAGAAATTAVVWMIVTQWLSAALGGYLAGRLRKRVSLTGDEVFFRDTAHGFLAWATGTIGMALLVSFFTYAVASGATRVAGAAAEGAAQAAATEAADDGPAVGSADWLAYYTDTLYRATPTVEGAPIPVDTNTGDARAESTRILLTSLRNGDVSAADRAYLGQLVASRTGLSQAEAQARVDKAIAEIKAAETEARAAADKARKAGAKLALFIALSLVIGAFIGAVMGGFGGRLRDDPAR